MTVLDVFVKFDYEPEDIHVNEWVSLPLNGKYDWLLDYENELILEGYKSDIIPDLIPSNYLLRELDKLSEIIIQNTNDVDRKHLKAWLESDYAYDLEEDVMSFVNGFLCFYEVNSLKELGYKCARNNGFVGGVVIPEYLDNYIDYEKYAQDNIRANVIKVLVPNSLYAYYDGD